MIKQALIKTLMICVVASLAISRPVFAQIDEFKITASDGAADDEFGTQVSINGDYAIVGARYDDDNGSNSGSAYMFMRTSTTWTEEAKLLPSDGEADDEFGIAVSIFGDYAIVGARYDDDNGSNSGSAYVFKRTGTTWNQEAKLTASDGAAGDRFGHRLSIFGDYAVVSAPFDDDNGSNSGSAYVFKRTGTTWTEEAKLLPTDGAAGDAFGYSVSISGDYIVLGATGDTDNGTNSGSAYVFKRTGASWAEEAKLLPSDGAVNDWFGYSVPIFGDYIVVSARLDDDNGINSGSVYVFKRTGTTWTEEAKLLPTDGAAGDEFGIVVSIFGDYAVVGAWHDDDNGTDSGSAYVFKRTGTTWTEEAKLLPTDGAAGDGFGFVSISGDYAVVGAWHDDDNGSNSGSTYIYHLEPAYDGPIWHVSTSGSNSNDGSAGNPFATIQHGIDVAFDEDTILVLPGTYIENLNFVGKNIIVGSLTFTTGDTSYISQTVIDGNQSGSVVTFGNGEDFSAVLSGFTITNGVAPYGGGIYCYLNSNPSLENLRIIENSASYFGGGIACNDTSSPNLENVMVSGNLGNYDGGGIACYDNSSPNLENVTITNNTAYNGSGGGIMFHTNSNSTLSNVMISGNDGWGSGGGIDLQNSSPTLYNVTIIGNTTHYHGGGIHCFGTSNPILQNVTISGNSADGYGGGIYGNASVVNTIIWNNSPEQNWGSPVITYSDIQGGYTGIGNIDADPLFSDADNGDFHLQEGSPCIDAGDPDLDGDSEDYSTDLDDQDLDGTRMDIGAYYYEQSVSIDFPPIIAEITDVLHDQGRWVFLSWSASGLDSMGEITQYGVWELNPEDEWVSLGNVPAIQEEEYLYLSHTFGDSTIDGIFWSKFKVTAHTANPEVFYSSVVDSGYSVDNLAPAVPTGLLASVTEENTVRLSWDSPVDEDFYHFKIYRSLDSDFDPTGLEPLAETIDTTFIDADVDGVGTYYYILSAVDFNGNESIYTEPVEAFISLSIDDLSGMPTEFGLHQNYPNPFNPITTLRYDLPEQSLVRITIYDILGREVRYLVNRIEEPGFNSVIWNATNDHEKSVSAGVYLFKIQAGEFVQTKKMILLK